MSRVLLIATNTHLDPYPVYPLGMSVVAAGLRQRGHRVRQFDLLAAGGGMEALREAISGFVPEFVGISLRNIDSSDSLAGDGAWFLERDRRVIRTIRECTPVPLILGGSAFSLMPEAVLDFLGCDHGLVGEGERALPDLIETLAAGRPAPRITRADPLLTGEEMCSPLLDPDLLGFYRDRSGLVNLQTKRGCPHACAYCSYPTLEGNRFRHRDPRAVAEDMLALRRDHGVEQVFFTDSIFNDPEGCYLGLAEELIRREVPVRWAAFFRPAARGGEGLDREKLALLKRAGLFALELGTDAASDTALAGLNKGFTFEEARAVNEACASLELPCAHFVMFGGPGETTATVREGLDNLRRLPPSVVFALAGVRIMPGTGLERRARAEGKLAPDASLLRPTYYFSPGVDPAAMEREIAKAFHGRRELIFPPAEGKLRMDVMHRFGYRGLLWDHLLSFRPPKPGIRASG